LLAPRGEDQSVDVEEVGDGQDEADSGGLDELPAVQPLEPGAEKDQKHDGSRRKAQGQKPQGPYPVKQGIADRVADSPEDGHAKHGRISEQDPRPGGCQADSPDHGMEKQVYHEAKGGGP